MEVEKNCGAHACGFATAPILNPHLSSFLIPHLCDLLPRPSQRLLLRRLLLLRHVQTVAHGHCRCRHRPVVHEDLVGLGVAQPVANGQRRRHVPRMVHGRGRSAGKRPASTALATTRYINSRSSSIMSCCKRSNIFTAGPSATIVEA